MGAAKAAMRSTEVSNKENSGNVMMSLAFGAAWDFLEPCLQMFDRFRIGENEKERAFNLWHKDG